MRLETSYGLGASGLMWLATENPHDLALHRDLQQAVRATLDRAYAAAKQLLAENRAALDALAAALVEHGYLDRGEIEAVMARVPLATAGTTDSPAVQAPAAEPLPGNPGPKADGAEDQTSGPDLVSATAGNVNG